MLKSLFGYFNNFAERATGLRIQPSADNRLSSTRKTLLADHHISLVIDVGANRGQWAKTLRQQNYQGEIISFEPSKAFEELRIVAERDPKWEIRNLALSKKVGTSPLYLSSNEQLSSSLLEPSGISHRRPDIAFKKTLDVSVSTLDKELGHNSKAFYLKIDTQGSEMDVLLGAVRSLTNCIAIEFESAIVPMYVGETLHHQIAEWLIGADFIPKQLVITDWDSDLNTLALDSIFVRKKN